MVLHSQQHLFLPLNFAWSASNSLLSLGNVLAFSCYKKDSEDAFKNLFCLPEVDDDDDDDDDNDYDDHNDDNLLVGKWPNVYKPCLNSRQWRTSSSFKPPASGKRTSEI